MKKKCQLPFIEPKIMSYDRFAFSWGVIKGNLGDEYNKILSRKFINCYFAESFPYEKFVISTMDSLSEKQNVVLNQTLDLHKDVASVLKLDFVSLIKKCISNGYYVFSSCPCAFFDEDAPQNLKVNFLVVGYDSINGIFSIKAFNGEGYLSTYEVNDKEFVDRLLNLPKENIVLQFWRFNKDNQIDLDLPTIETEFDDYINSKTSLVQYTKNKVYGIKAFENLNEYFKKQLELGCPLEREYLQSVADHKYCMWKRLKYFAQQQIVSNEYVVVAEQVYKLSICVLGVGLEYNATSDRITGKKAIEYLSNLIEKEREYLPKVLEELTAAKLAYMKDCNK